MAKTIRLTVAQALVKFLNNQYIEFDGKENRMAGGLLLFAEDIGLVQLGGALAIFLGVYLTTHSDQLAKCWGKATDA